MANLNGNVRVPVARRKGLMSVPLKGSAGCISQRVSIRRARWALRNSMIVRHRSRQPMCSTTGFCPSVSNRRFRSVASYPIGARNTVEPRNGMSMNAIWQWRISITRARKPKVTRPMGFVSGCTRPFSMNSIGWRLGKNYASLVELQADLDAWLASYNHERPDQGRWCYGKTPMQTCVDSVPLAKEKMLAA